MTRKQAKELGLKVYVSDTTCIHGHVNPRRRTTLGDCEECRQARNKLTDKNTRRKRKLKHRYNMTLEQYDELYLKQNGLCAACKLPPYPNEKLFVDHSHSNNIVRGLLHNDCNLALGVLKEDINKLKGLIEYLKNFNY